MLIYTNNTTLKYISKFKKIITWLFYFYKKKKKVIILKNKNSKNEFINFWNLF